MVLRINFLEPSYLKKDLILKNLNQTSLANKMNSKSLSKVHNYKIYLNNCLINRVFNCNEL